MSTEPQSLDTLLTDAVAAHGDAVALRADDTVWTWAQLDDRVTQCAGHLAALGVGAGSRVGLSAGNGTDFVVAVFATLRRGATIVMISTAWRDREVQHALALTEPHLLLHDASGATDLTALSHGIPVVHLDALHGEPPSPAAAVHADPDRLAVMVFSSGTTGLPKAVRHTHRSLHHATQHWVAALGLTADDRLQIATPPFHILGLLNLLAVAAAGASVRLHRRFDLDTVLAAIEADRITIEMAVAPIAIAMANHPSLERYDLSSLRYIMWGATPVTPAVAHTVTRRTGVRFLAGYGASEVPVLAVNPVHRPDDWRLESVGFPPDGVTMRVTDLDTGEVLGPGLAGELEARSPSAMLGYLPDDANEAAFHDGWYRTGDVGSIDEDGRVTITDRVKEMVKVNGFQVAPAEVEAVLLSHPAVADCAVYGTPDQRTGEAVIAAVVLRPDATATAEELQAFVAGQLASYKRVREVRFLPQIPRLPSGKVLRRELMTDHRSG